MLLQPTYDVSARARGKPRKRGERATHKPRAEAKDTLEPPSHSRGTVWITGLPAAGKTTLAVAIQTRLSHNGVAAHVLDGDTLRHGLNADLGFSREDRLENVRRVSEVARVLGAAGVVAIVAVVSPHLEGRARAREMHTAAQLGFLEVWLATPLTECERRDPKGLYAGARAGEVHHLTGVDDPYEPPTDAELELQPGPDSVEECVEAVLRALREHWGWAEVAPPISPSR